MLNVTTEQISDWLTKTVPGLIVLGMTGSLLAIPAYRLIRRAALATFKSFLVSNFRPYLRSRLLTRLYVSRNDTARLTAWLIFAIFGGIASVMLYATLVTLAGIYFAIFGLHYVRASVVIAATLGVWGMMAFRDLLMLSGVFIELLSDDLQNIRNETKSQAATVIAMQRLHGTPPADALGERTRNSEIGESASVAERG